MAYSNVERFAQKHKSSPQPKAKTENERSILDIINGINALITQAHRYDMGTAARILHAAREELVYWAVDMNFHETVKDRFINDQLYSDHVTNAMMLQSFVGMLKQSIQVMSETSGKRAKHSRRREQKES